MITALDDAISKFERKGVDHYLRNYIETVISMAFFKVPPFKKKFLACLENHV